MKRFLAVVVLSLVVVQLCLLPIAVNGVVCPSVVTLPATNITSSTATLNGSVTIAGPTGSVSFQYGTAPGVYTADTEPPTAMIASGTFLANISGLSPCTTYYARAKIHLLQARTLNHYVDGIKGAGLGLDYKNLQQLFYAEQDPEPDCSDTYYGSVISFQTTGCQTFIGTGTTGGSSFSGTTTSTTPPVTNPVIQTQSASLSAKTVTPGTPITVTADIINKSSVNGSKKVTLYVNGQVETTQGITVNSGGSTKLTFNVSRSEPGDYAVYVDGVPAGSFKVELFRESDGILIFSAVLVALAFLIGVVLLWRRQRAV